MGSGRALEGLCPHGIEAAQDRVRSILGCKMESTAIYRKPKKWTAAVLGLLVQPLGMLYVARPGWAAAYLALAAIIALSNMSVLRGRELAGDAILLLVAVICAIHAYRLARDYRAVKRPWYSRWYGFGVIVA